MRRSKNSTRTWIVISSTAALLFCGWHSPAQAQPVEYEKVCDAYGSGYYYIPGSDVCLKIGGYIDEKNLPAGSEAPKPPAGCATCRELDAEIEKLTERYIKLDGKGVPKWREELAGDIANLQKQKAECQKVCTPPAQTTREDVKVCDAYGAGFYYIPGSDICLKLGRYTDEKKVSQEVTPPPPPAGCQTCAALDTEIKSLEAQYKTWQAKGGGTLAATNMKQLDAQITKLQELKAGCQKVCTAPPRTAKKQTPGQYYKKEVPPLRTFTPPAQRQKFHDARESALKNSGG